MDKYDLPASYQLLSESGEATSAMLDKKVSVHALLCLLCWLSCGCCCVCYCITHLLFILQFYDMQAWTIIQKNDDNLEPSFISVESTNESG